MTKSMCDQSYGGMCSFSGVCLVCAGVSYLLCSCYVCVLDGACRPAYTKSICL